MFADTYRTQRPTDTHPRAGPSMLASQGFQRVMPLFDRWISIGDVTYAALPPMPAFQVGQPAACQSKRAMSSGDDAYTVTLSPVRSHRQESSGSCCLCCLPWWPFSNEDEEEEDEIESCGKEIVELTHLGEHDEKKIDKILKVYDMLKSDKLKTLITGAEAFSKRKIRDRERFVALLKENEGLYNHMKENLDLLIREHDEIEKAVTDVREERGEDIRQILQEHVREEDLQKAVSEVLDLSQNKVEVETGIRELVEKLEIGEEQGEETVERLLKCTGKIQTAQQQNMENFTSGIVSLANVIVRKVDFGLKTGSHAPLEKAYSIAIENGPVEKSCVEYFTIMPRVHSACVHAGFTGEGNDIEIAFEVPEKEKYTLDLFRIDGDTANFGDKDSYTIWTGKLQNYGARGAETSVRPGAKLILEDFETYFKVELPNNEGCPVVFHLRPKVKRGWFGGESAPASLKFPHLVVKNKEESKQSL